MFAPDALEIRFVAGTFGGGPSTAWFRLRAPIVAGEEPTPLQRLAAAGDFGNGISTILPWSEYMFINPDLTLYIERPPVGEWIALEAQTTIAPGRDRGRRERAVRRARAGRARRRRCARRGDVRSSLPITTKLGVRLDASATSAGTP